MKPRILFILHLPPPVHGAAMVGKYIHDSKLINEAFDCRYLNLAIANSIEDIGKVSLGKISATIKMLMNIRREVKTFRPDLVYVTPNASGGAFFKEFLVVQALKQMGCNVIAHYHNKGVSTRQDNWLYDQLYRRFFKRVKVILLAKALYPDMQKYVRRADVAICPNGIPAVDYAYTERHNTPTRLLFLSNLIESKGVLVLLDALALLKKKGQSFFCDFVGGETFEIDRSRFDREVALRQLTDCVVYHGPKHGKEKDAYFEQTDIFVFPTAYPREAFPLVNLEAMAHYLPVVSTNEGGITDMVRNGINGLICPKEDPQSLADCIEQLITDKDLRIKMGIAGHSIYENEYTMEHFEKNMLNILNTTIAHLATATHESGE